MFFCHYRYDPSYAGIYQTVTKVDDSNSVIEKGKPEVDSTFLLSSLIDPVDLTNDVLIIIDNHHRSFLFYVISVTQLIKIVGKSDWKQLIKLSNYLKRNPRL